MSMTDRDRRVRTDNEDMQESSMRTCRRLWDDGYNQKSIPTNACNRGSNCFGVPFGAPVGFEVGKSRCRIGQRNVACCRPTTTKKGRVLLPTKYDEPSVTTATRLLVQTSRRCIAISPHFRPLVAALFSSQRLGPSSHVLVVVARHSYLTDNNTRRTYLVSSYRSTSALNTILPMFSSMTLHESRSPVCLLLPACD